MRRAVLLLALGACGNRKPMTARCELEPAGAEVPTKLQDRPWLLHDLKVAEKLSRRFTCTIRGRTDEKVWSDEPAVKGKTTHGSGVAKLVFHTTDFPAAQDTLVLHWADGSATVPVPALPRIDVAVHTDGNGVAHLTGTVTGADAVTIGGDPVPLAGGELALDVNLAPWLFAHATVADLPLDPLPHTLTMLVTAGESHAMATMPAPQLALEQWLQGVLDPTAAVPYAPPVAEDRAGRPTVIVYRPAVGAPRLLGDAKLGAIELVADAREVAVSHSTCTYKLGNKLELYRADLEVVVRVAQTGARVAKRTVEGLSPPPCPNVVDGASTEDAARTGAVDLDGLRGWLATLEAKP